MTNLEKLKQNLETIEEGLFDKFVEECKAQNRKVRESEINDPHYLMGSMVFRKTKQGHDYWWNKYILYSELIKNK